MPLTETERTRRRDQKRRITPKGRLQLLIGRARRRAQKAGREFSIRFEDLHVPEVCPVLGIPLGYARGTPLANRPSLDRTNNDLGYVKGNVKIISFRANMLKASASIDEVQRILDYMRLEELAS